MTSAEKVLEDAHPVALRKVKISSDLLSIAPTPGNVIRNLKDWLPTNYIWVGYNLMLDFMFLRGATDPETRFQYRFLDITTIAELYFAIDGIETKGKWFSLSNLATELEVPLEIGQLHSAREDVKVSLEVFKSIMYKIRDIK